jgi:hypothetical protein
MIPWEKNIFIAFFSHGINLGVADIASSIRDLGGKEKVIHKPVTCRLEEIL